MIEVLMVRLRFCSTFMMMFLLFAGFATVMVLFFFIRCSKSSLFFGSDLRKMPDESDRLLQSRCNRQPASHPVGNADESGLDPQEIPIVEISWHALSRSVPM